MWVSLLAGLQVCSGGKVIKLLEAASLIQGGGGCDFNDGGYKEKLVSVSLF